MTTVDTAPEDLDPPPPEPPAPERTGVAARVTNRWPELVVTAASVLLFSWGLGANGYGNAYYSAAARSMTSSWSNFFYASLDPGGWVTVDKPPMALWTQALSARLFGFHGWSLLLPSVLCGALSVWVLMATVRRPWGRAAGLVAGVVLALTPMIVAVSRSNNPDATLVLCVVLAAWAVQRGIADGKVRWMLLAGAFCGVGFLSKLLAAGLVMPGLWGAYLLCAPGRLRTRVLHCLAGAAVFFGIAVAWVAAVDLRPLTDRPWVGGSTDGSARDLVFGYNGFGRITGASEGPGGGAGPAGGGFGGAGGINQFGGPTGIGRLFNPGMGDQAMWLIPMVVVSTVAALWAAVRERRRDERLGSVVLWAGWAGVVFLLFSFASGIFHNYYISLLAPALAALVGIGVAQALRVHRLGTVVVSLTLLATAALQVVLLRRVDAWTWLRWAVPATVVIAAAVAVVAAFAAPSRRRVLLGALAIGGTALMVAPAVWSLSGVRSPQSGTFPDARPTTASTGPGSGGPLGGVAGGGVPGGFPGGAGGGPGGGRGAQISAAEWRWLESQRSGERWILAFSSSMEASTALTTGRDVVALGGFSGSDGSGSVTRIADAVERGELRFFSAGSTGGLGGGPGGGGWTTAVRSACTAVDASAWGGSGTSGIYDCAGKADALRAAAPAAGPTAGGGQGGPPGAGQGPAGADLAGLRQCLADQGVEISDGQRPDFSDTKVQRAMQACSAYLPSGAGGPGGGGAPPGGGGAPPGGTGSNPPPGGAAPATP